MRIELLEAYVTRARAYKPGERIDLADTDAIRLIERKLAKPVRGKKAEQAVAPKGERATTNLI